MRKRRLANEAKRIAKIERTLADVALTRPQDLPAPEPVRPAPLPSGGGLASGIQPRTQDEAKREPFKPVLFTRRQSPKRRARDRDLESGLAIDAGAAQDAQGNWLVRLWESLPGPGELAFSAFDFLDTYAPIILLLSVPTTWLVTRARAEASAYLFAMRHRSDPTAVAPPPPPAAPDTMKAAQAAFFELALAEPVTYLVLDLGLAFFLGTLSFFWKDINDWLEARRLAAGRAGSYQRLDGEAEAASPQGQPPPPQEEEQAPISAQAMRMELQKVINVIEEVG